MHVRVGRIQKTRPDVHQDERILKSKHANRHQVLSSHYAEPRQHGALYIKNRGKYI